jgi:hypothetical protein
MSLLSKSFQINKLLFLAFVLFVCGQVFFTYKGVETFPFWNYGMYSAKLAKHVKLETYNLYINGKKLDLNSIPRSKNYISYRLKSYDYNSEKEKFGLWLKKYLSGISSESIEEITLEHCSYSADMPYTLIQKNEYSLYQSR